ncbi:hypothetical protein [Roseovarius sp.]|uniref:hypothetical protein n=1 Tax=Roseovarius sp. TaxID=1486281 RepID=UPI003A97FA59
MLEVCAKENENTGPIAFGLFQRRCESFFAFIAARGAAKLGVAGIDWAQRWLAAVPENPAAIIDFSAGIDPKADVGQRYLRNKGGAFVGNLHYAETCIEWSNAQ